MALLPPTLLPWLASFKIVSMASSTSHRAGRLRSPSPCTPGSPPSSLAQSGFDPPYLLSIIKYHKYQSSNIKAQKLTYLECRLMNNRGGSSHVKSLKVKSQTPKNALEVSEVDPWEFQRNAHIIFNCHPVNCSSHLLWELEVSFARRHVPVIGESSTKADHAEISLSTG